MRVWWFHLECNPGVFLTVSKMFSTRLSQHKHFSNQNVPFDRIKFIYYLFLNFSFFILNVRSITSHAVLFQLIPSSHNFQTVPPKQNQKLNEKWRQKKSIQKLRMKKKQQNNNKKKIHIHRVRNAHTIIQNLQSPSNNNNRNR